jgi:hypothetical protein
VKTLLPLDFDGIADGHVGFTGAARPALFRLANERFAPPTVSVRTGQVGPTTPIAERTGIYVQSPRDVRGEEPTLVVFSDGASWRVSDGPVAGRADWNGRAVVVRARVLDGGSGPGLPVELESIRLADPQPATRPLTERSGEWVTVRGTIRRLEPLSRGAGWGEGELVLDDGTAVALAAPLGVVVGGPTELLARVDKEGEGKVRLVAAPLTTRAEGGSDGRGASP